MKRLIVGILISTVVIVTGVCVYNTMYPKLTPISVEANTFRSEFYSLVPEMISYGQLFDTRFVVYDIGKTITNGESIGFYPSNNQNFGSAFALVMKANANMKFDLLLEFYKGDEKIYETNYSGMNYNSSTLMHCFMGIEGGMGENYVALGHYYFQFSRKECIDYDGVKMTFTYLYNGKQVEEIHDLKYNSELSKEFFFETMSSYYSEDSWSGNHNEYTTAYVRKYLYSLLVNDFDTWIEVVKKLENDSITSEEYKWSNEFLREFYNDIFQDVFFDGNGDSHVVAEYEAAKDSIKDLFHFKDE